MRPGHSSPPAGLRLFRHLRSTAALALLLAAAGGAAVDGATSGAAADPFRFWRPESREAESAYEAALTAVPDPASLARHHERISSAPHVAGTPGDLAVVEALAGAFSDLGLEVEKQELWLYLPRPVVAELEIVAPERLALPLREEALAEDPYSADPRLDDGWNAWSGSGEATAGVVYANHATNEDFARLALEREWLDPAGLPGRPWFRNLYAAPDADSGYAAWMLPALRQAVEERDADAARAAVVRYGEVLARLSARIAELAALTDDGRSRR